MSAESTRPKRPWALLAFLALSGFASVALPFFLPPPAYLQLILVDGVFGSELRGLGLRLQDQESKRVMSAKVGDNRENTTLVRFTSGRRRFVLDVDGFEPVSFELSAPPVMVVRYEAKLVPKFGQLEVRVVDSQKVTQPVASAPNVQLADRSTAAAAEPLPGGVLFTRLSPGKHKLSATAEHFCPGEREATIEAARRTKVLLPLSAEIQGREQARLILDWEDEPRDIDAHLFVEQASAAIVRPHVFYKNPVGRANAGEIYARLDVDYQNSEGFETTTIYRGMNGLFRYVVFWFAGRGTLGDSRAKVELFTEGCHRDTFEVDASCSTEAWHVLDLQVRDGRVELIKQNKCPPEVPFSQERNPKLEDVFWTIFSQVVGNVTQ